MVGVCCVYVYICVCLWGVCGVCVCVCVCACFCVCVWLIDKYSVSISHATIKSKELNMYWHVNCACAKGRSEPWPLQVVCELLGIIILSACLVWGSVTTVAIILLTHHYGKFEISLWIENTTTFSDTCTQDLCFWIILVEIPGIEFFGWSWIFVSENTFRDGKGNLEFTVVMYYLDNAQRSY